MSNQAIDIAKYQLKNFIPVYGVVRYFRRTRNIQDASGKYLIKKYDRIGTDSNTDINPKTDHLNEMLSNNGIRMLSDNDITDRLMQIEFEEKEFTNICRISTQSRLKFSILVGINAYVYITGPLILSRYWPKIYPLLESILK